MLSELSDDNEVFRIDAEYFSKSVLLAIHRLQSLNAQPLAMLATITDGIHTSLPFVDNGNVKVLSAKHPKDNFIDCEQFETITAEFHAANPRTALRENDVILSTVGTIGNSAVVTENILPANSDRHIGIIRTNLGGPNPYFVSTALTSFYGRIQSVRETTGNVQPNLFISKIRRLLIPRFSNEFETVVADQAQQAYAMRRLAAQHLESAEQTLLNALGLDSWAPPDALTYVRSSCEALAAGRLDAEHYQPRFAALLTLIDATGDGARLGDHLLENKRGKQPYYTDSGLRVVNSKHVLRNDVRLDVDNRLANFDEDDLLISHGDVLVNGTGVGTIGRTAAYLHDSQAIPDNHVTILRPSKTLDPIYLSVFLNSIAGQFQVEQRLRGSSGQIELYPNDIAEFRVWLAPKELQQSIRQQVELSFAQKQLATQLLDAAKRAVEIAIEESEQTSLAYLNKGVTAP